MDGRFYVLYVPDGNFLISQTSGGNIPHLWRKDSTIVAIVDQLNTLDFTAFRQINKLPLLHKFSYAEFEAVFYD